VIHAARSERRQRGAFRPGRRPARHDPPRPGRSPVRPGKAWREACRTTAGGGGLPVAGRAALIASAAASEVRAVACLSAAICGSAL